MAASTISKVPEPTVRGEYNFGEVFHVPPSATELNRRVDEMCEFANAKTPGGFIHPMLRSMVLHFWLAYDHPFVDGNGRTARALFYWSMLKQGCWLFEYITISKIIHNASVKYGEAFLYTEKSLDRRAMARSLARGATISEITKSRRCENTINPTPIWCIP